MGLEPRYEDDEAALPRGESGAEQSRLNIGVSRQIECFSELAFR